MTTRSQTSVLVSPAAVEALSAIAQTRRASKDEALRQLLREYIEAQLRLPEEFRLTHISTLLRYPPKPLPHEHAVNRVRLAPRLDEGLAARAAGLSFRLPGQPVKRGPGEYSARPLTDAVVTAIAMKNPFVDQGLEGLPALVPQRAALGIWRLTVAATLTNAEQDALLSSRSDVAVVLREEDVAWHERWRFDVALHVCQQLLVGSGATTGLRLVTDQGDDFRQLVFDLERSTDLDHHLVRGAPDPAANLAGRGGTAVWRAQRNVAMTELAAALVRSDNSVGVLVTPPGWRLSLPARWRGHHYRHGQPLTDLDREHLDRGRVLRLESGSRSVLWPYGADGTPIAGFDTVLAAAGVIGAPQTVELCLVHTEDLFGYPQLPAIKAFEQGFISAGERDELLARAANDRREIAERAARRRRSPLSADDVDMLAALVEHPDEFARLARKLQR